jgi:hypothetical protein
VTNPSEGSPGWSHNKAGELGPAAVAEVILGGPAADPSEGPNTVLLNVFADGDWFRWSAYYVVEGEDAPFGEGEIEWSSSADLETAKRDAWDTAVTFLKSLGYEDQEIGDAVTAGSAR